MFDIVLTNWYFLSLKVWDWFFIFWSFKFKILFLSTKFDFMFKIGIRSIFVIGLVIKCKQNDIVSFLIFLSFKKNIHISMCTIDFP